MPAVRAQAMRWLSGEPQPGLVEVMMTDASGRQWTFVDKWPIFSAQTLTDQTQYPVGVLIDCELTDEDVGGIDQNLVLISTEKPWGVQTTEGQTEFVIRRDQLNE